MKRKFMLILFAIILIFLASNFLTANDRIISTQISEKEDNHQVEIYNETENQENHLLLEKDNTVFHREIRKEELIVKDGDEVKIINDYYPSEPVISPDKSRLVYISPYEWEKIGQLYLYDARNEENEIILGTDDIPEQDSVKQVHWVNDEYLITIVGYGMGTVSVGGDVYLTDIENEVSKKIFEAENRQEVKNIKITEDEIIFEIAEFDENYLEYDIIDQEYEKEEIIDKGRNLVKENFEEKYNNVQKQLELLYEAMATGEAAEAVESWARGITLKNGSLQYAALSPELRNKTFDLYSAVDWQPEIPNYFWINRYQISEIEEYDENIRIYQVNFEFLNIYDDSYEIEVEVFAEKQDEYWFIKSVESESDEFYFNLSK